jgi:hypothetical protein
VHSKRKFAITSLVSAKEEIGNQNIKVAARHKSDDAHRQYQRSAPALHDRRFRAIWAAGKIREDKTIGGDLLSILIVF